MDNDILSLFARNKRAVIVVLVLLVAVIISFGIAEYVKNKPVNLEKTNLIDASSSVRQKAADQLSVPIKQMPEIIDEEATKSLENQLAYVLRQKYGPAADSMSATVRQAIGYDDAGGFNMLVDVPDKNETYLAHVNLRNGLGSFVCADQAQQMDPDTSNCFTLTTIDDNSFPNG